MIVYETRPRNHGFQGSLTQFGTIQDHGGVQFTSLSSHRQPSYSQTARCHQASTGRGRVRSGGTLKSTGRCCRPNWFNMCPVTKCKSAVTKPARAEIVFRNQNSWKSQGATFKPHVQEFEAKLPVSARICFIASFVSSNTGRAVGGWSHRSAAEEKNIKIYQDPSMKNLKKLQILTNL